MTGRRTNGSLRIGFKPEMNWRAPEVLAISNVIPGVVSWAYQLQTLFLREDVNESTGIPTRLYIVIGGTLRTDYVSDVFQVAMKGRAPLFIRPRSHRSASEMCAGSERHPKLECCPKYLFPPHTLCQFLAAGLLAYGGSRPSWSHVGHLLSLPIGDLQTLVKVQRDTSPVRGCLYHVTTVAHLIRNLN
jgi:hypothetical protein